MIESAAPIDCLALTKRYGGHLGVGPLDLSVKPGSITGFLGANGAGKTTLIRMLVGLLRPTAGQALLWGQPAMEASARSRLGYMPADPAFYPELTGQQNLDLLSELHGNRPSQRQWALDLLELSSDTLNRRVGEYSSGMHQKLGLVQAVQHRPDLIILDEPANRLDPLAHRHFEQLLGEIAADGRTVFLSSHTLSEVEDVCHTVAMIRDGHLLAIKDVAELSAVALRTVHAVYREPPTQLPDGLHAVELHGTQLTARVPRGAIGVLREMLASDELIDLTIEPGSLEEAFISLYSDDAQAGRPR
jgi:ABC-2 type transport system ATP-binding protein